MALFKKKEGVPDLPKSQPLPSLPELPKANAEPVKRELPELPSFPTSPKNENFNQEMVKSAISDPANSNEISRDHSAFQKPEMSEFPSAPTPIQAPEPQAPIPQTPVATPTPQPIPDLPKTQSMEMKESLSPIPPMQASQTEKKNEPIFVRIDKFQATQKIFNEVKAKASEMADILKSIQEVKAQEEEELKNWAEDLEKLKNRLAEIDDGIFSQL